MKNLKPFGRVDEANKKVPTEDQVLDVIFNNVFIRGIDLSDYRESFTDKTSGLYTELLKLFGH